MCATAQSAEDKDIRDIVRQVLKIAPPTDSTTKPCGRINYSGLGGGGYSLQTGMAVTAFGNATFVPCKDITTKVSSVLASVTYSQYKQIIIPIQANLWTTSNKYNIVTDWHYMKFPSLTYGIGGYTKLSDAYSIDYSFLHLHQKVLRYVAKYFYLGPGLAYDYFWNIKEIDPPVRLTAFELYHFSKTASASGITLNAIYDNRHNSVNPEKGFYASVNYRDNLTFLGSDANWQSLQLDTRAYIKLPGKSSNVLAFWSYDWFTLAGAPPYLLLPTTGGDMYSNIGRGYIAGRFRGKNMLYLESEYRFNITHNGLIGAVIFANAQSFSELSNKFETIAPGFGGGLRVKLNKNDRTNLAIDYGVGANGSKGFFVNLGEVF